MKKWPGNEKMIFFIFQTKSISTIFFPSQTLKLSLEQKNPFGGSKPMKVTVKPDSKLFKQQQRQQAVKNVHSEFLASVQAQNRLQQLAQTAVQRNPAQQQQSKKPDMAKFFSGDF